MGHSEAVFYFISVFSIQLTVNKCSINFADDYRVDNDDEADDGDLRRKTVSASNQNPHLRSD